MNFDLNDILSKFKIDSVIKPYGNGHINDTYCVEPHKYILQRINTSIFKNPDKLMQNIENVTAFLKKQIVADHGNPDLETLTIIKTVDGNNYYEADKNNVFRLYKFISGTKTIEDGATENDMYNAGKGFGKFTKMLDRFPIEKLNETIKDFHNTPKRVLALKKAIETDTVGRKKYVKKEIDFALRNAHFADKVTGALKASKIPLRVTHNDTKINNILFDEKSSEPTCVIDLDTVMPGSMLYDFGDALRIGASTASEDETDLKKVHFDENIFKAFAKGYINQVKDVITETEASLLAFSAKLMTYECGIRFLTDYLNGDKYFKIHKENHNLDRARNQFKLVEEISKKEDMLNDIIKDLIE
ncbi:MAG: aminoglycoside phosphotransferase family protein [Clostridia bacterium]|nr:aminoglycoside phosphotransferase family protein [Clostridia bacterium]